MFEPVKTTSIEPNLKTDALTPQEVPESTLAAINRCRDAHNQAIVHYSDNNGESGSDPFDSTEKWKDQRSIAGPCHIYQAVKTSSTSSPASPTAFSGVQFSITSAASSSMRRRPRLASSLASQNRRKKQKNVPLPTPWVLRKVIGVRVK